MKIKVQERRFLAQVICTPPANANGRFRAGRHWPTGATQAEITETTKAALEGDKMPETHVIPGQGGQPGKETPSTRSFFVVIVQQELPPIEVEKEVPDNTPAPPSIASPEIHPQVKGAIDELFSRHQHLEGRLSRTQDDNERLERQLKARDEEIAQLRKDAEQNKAEVNTTIDQIKKEALARVEEGRAEAKKHAEAKETKGHK